MNRARRRRTMRWPCSTYSALVRVTTARPAYAQSCRFVRNRQGVRTPGSLGECCSHSTSLPLGMARRCASQWNERPLRCSSCSLRWPEWTSRWPTLPRSGSWWGRSFSCGARRADSDALSRRDRHQRDARSAVPAGASAEWRGGTRGEQIDGTDERALENQMRWKPRDDTTRSLKLLG